jgi:uncharacterized protein with PIN domain
MKCHLCEKEILKYNPSFHHIKIDEKHEYDICPQCVNKLVKWQGKIYMDLFPTKLSKKIKDKDSK